MKIEAGQIYYSANPANNNRRIRVLSEPVMYGAKGNGKVVIAVIDESGEEFQFRRINVSQLHATILTREGNSRRRGYILEK